VIAIEDLPTGGSVMFLSSVVTKKGRPVSPVCQGTKKDPCQTKTPAIRPKWFAAPSRDDQRRRGRDVLSVPPAGNESLKPKRSAGLTYGKQKARVEARTNPPIARLARTSDAGMFPTRDAGTRGGPNTALIPRNGV
jgi:hypothetical protein